MSTIKILPSILAADFAAWASRSPRWSGPGRRDHIDVMDGRFVPNISLGPFIVEAVRHTTSLTLDVHLMIVEPERYVDDFARAGADIISVHQEACLHLHRTVQHIKQLGKQAGVVLNPGTPLSSLEDLLDEVDLILLMSVDPGFGGQRFIAASTDKVRRLRELLDARDSTVVLEIDGGIDPHTAPQAVAAGARMLVAGSAVFGAPVGPAQGVKRLRDSLA